MRPSGGLGRGRDVGRRSVLPLFVDGGAFGPFVPSPGKGPPVSFGISVHELGVTPEEPEVPEDPEVGIEAIWKIEV